MRFVSNNVPYHFHFRYSLVGKPDARLKDFQHGERVQTTCFITTGNGENRVTLHEASCLQSIHDRFDKHTGRKKALLRVLQKWTNDRNLRREVWQTYFQTHNDKIAI